MAKRWAISDPRWDSRLSLRLLRLGFLGIWSAFALTFVVGAIHAGTLNKGAITRTATPVTFWLVIGFWFVAGVATFVYNLYLFFRRRSGTPEAV